MSNKKLEEEAKKRRTDPVYSTTYKNCDQNWQKYAEMMSSRIIVSWKNDIFKKCCSNPQKYKNGIGKMLFWSCSSCGADLGDVND